MNSSILISVETILKFDQHDMHALVINNLYILTIPSTFVSHTLICHRLSICIIF